MESFRERVLQFVRSIPRGKVVSYGQVAASVGAPRAAREVGWILRATGGNDIPWWRVVNREGKISIKANFENTPAMQKSLLEAEGILVSEDLSLDMTKHQYQP